MVGRRRHLGQVIIIAMCVVALSGCTRQSDGDIEVYDAVHNEHEYVIFENEKSGCISVLHSLDCQCKKE
jgi:type IV pilus biogenesis protein CpaD/CtpE